MASDADRGDVGEAFVQILLLDVRTSRLRAEFRCTKWQTVEARSTMRGLRKVLRFKRNKESPKVREPWLVFAADLQHKCRQELNNLSLKHRLRYFNARRQAPVDTALLQGSPVARSLSLRLVTRSLKFMSVLPYRVPPKTPAKITKRHRGNDGGTGERRKPRAVIRRTAKLLTRVTKPSRAAIRRTAKLLTSVAQPCCKGPLRAAQAASHWLKR